MFNKISFKGLLAVFAVLLMLSIVVILLNRSNSAASKNRTFKSELTDFDTANVTHITIIPKLGGIPVDLFKHNEQWKVSIDEQDYNADPSVVKGMLSNLMSLKATRVAANKKDQWAKYEVTDSAATHVLVNEGRKIVADIYLGKFSYQQPKNANPYMYQQQGKMTSYIRLAGDKQVYAVDGMIAMTFNRQGSDFRNRTLIRSKQENWNHLTFTTPENSYSLTKQGTNWTIDGLLADSASVASYISSMAWLNSSSFIEESVLTSNSAVYTLSIEGENMVAPIKIFAFPADTINIYAITSSLNNGTYFSGSKNGLFNKIFVEKDSFLNIPASVTENQ